MLAGQSRGHTERFSSQLFIAKTTDNLFSISLSWLVEGGSITENVSRLNQVFHTVRHEARYLSNDCFRACRRGVSRKTVKQKLYSFKKFLCSFVFIVGSFKHLICYLLFDSVSDF